MAMNRKLKKRAVFLDRDGTLVHLKLGEYTTSPKQLRLLPGAATAVRALNRIGYSVVIITNQGVIAKGKTTHKEVDYLHAILIDRLGKKGARVDAVYYCPHHPEGKIPKYAIRCRCRKPEIGMITKAMKDMSIDMKKSFLIGDTTGDILTGHRAGLTTILVKTGYGGQDKKHDVKPDFVVRNLTAAVRYIKKHAQPQG